MLSPAAKASAERCDALLKALLQRVEDLGISKADDEALTAGILDLAVARYDHGCLVTADAERAECIRLCEMTEAGDYAHKTDWREAARCCADLIRARSESAAGVAKWEAA